MAATLHHLKRTNASLHRAKVREGSVNHLFHTQQLLVSFYVHPVVRNLGIMLDSSLNFNKQINSVVESVLLSRSDLEILIHAFITSRLHYCNILCTGLSQSNIHKLQMVQNAAARMLTGTKKREHITPVLAQLHWLPVKFRIDFKILLFVFKAVNGSAPPLYC